MSARVALDRLRQADAPAIARVLADAGTAQWLSSLPFPYGLAEARKFIAKAGPEDHAIRVDGTFAGVVRGSHELGYWVAPEFRRRGVARRAAVLALSRSFAAGRDEVAASHVAGNAASSALLARLGFDGAQPGTVFSQRAGREVPAVLLSLPRAVFAARHGIRLVTDRLLIDRPMPEDLPALYAIATRPEVARMLFLFAPGMAMRDFAPIFPQQALVPPMRLAIRHRGAVIGSIGIGPVEGEGGAPIFYFLTPESWGQGFGREVLDAFLAEIDARFGLPCLTAEVFADNPASARMLEGAGFRHAGDRMLSSAGRGGMAPGWLYLRHRD
ncbi:MAG: GNAT family N-acetyltransferase [Paracoccus sp. (in: a-proteobacteria)]